VINKMKQKNQHTPLSNSQSGIVHLILIVGIVVVTAGAIGVSFMTSYSEKARTSASQTQTDKELAAKATPKQQTANPDAYKPSDLAPTPTTSTSPSTTTQPKTQPSTTPTPSPTMQTAPPVDPCAINKSVSPNSTVTTIWDKPNTGSNGATQVKDVYYYQQFLAQASSCANDGWIKASFDGYSGYIWFSSVKYN